MLAARRCLHSSADIVMRAAPKFLNLSQRAKLIDHFEGALLAYNWLSSWAAGEDSKLYPMKPKCHALQHIAMDFGVNPRRTVCYLDEDVVGRSKRIYNGCHGSSAPYRSLQRYLIIIGIRWLSALRRMRLAAVRRNRV